MDLLPSHDPVVSKYKTVLTSFNRFDYLLIDVGPDNDGRAPSRDELISAADTLVGKMSVSEYFNDIQYRLLSDDMISSFSMLKRHRASLFTEEDKRELEERLTTESIRETFRGWKKLLTESPAPFLAGSFHSDPLAMDIMLLKKLDDLKSMDGEVKIEDGRIFSRDMKHIFILALPVYPGTDNSHARELIDFMDRTILETETVHPGLINIAYMGSHRFGLDNADMIKRDIRMTLTLSASSIAILALLAFRRPIVMSLLTMIPAFFGGAFASFMIMLVYPDISAIAIGCGAMLMGIAVDFGIHFLYHADQVSEEDSNQSGIINILDKLTRPLMLTAATTLIAFLTLELSVLPGYRQLGLFAVFGIAGAFTCALLVLPLLIPTARQSLRRPVINMTGIYPMFFRWVKGHKKVLIIIVLILSCVSAPGIYRLKFEGDIQKLNAVFPETKKDWDTVISSFGGILDTTTVVVRGKDMEEALQRNEMLYSELLDMREQGKIQGSNSIAPLFPSMARQEENRERWQRFWSPERIDRIMKDVEEICLELRIRPEAVRDVLAGLPGTIQPLELEDFDTGFLRTIAANQLSMEEDGAMIMTNLQVSEDSEYTRIAAMIEDSIPGSIITNGRYFVRHIVSLIHMEMIRLGGVTLLFVAVIMFLYTRRISSFVSLMLPLFLSLFWTFGIMGWIGIKFNIMNAMIVIFIFGIVDDYSVFLHEALRHSGSGNDRHLSHTSGAITLSAITTFLGLGSLIFARHPALHSIGATAVLGITFGLASVFLTVPLRGYKSVSD